MVWSRARSVLVPLMFLAIGLATASSASAGPLVASADACDDSPLTRPFLPWLDPMQYVEQPGGSFESDPAGWQLGTASVAGGNEPYNARAAGDSQSLAIPAGGSVTTSTMCVGLDKPTLRFFARSSGISSLRVDVLFEDAAGNVRSLPIGLASGGSWKPTGPMPIVANLLVLLPGAQTPVRFRFVPQGSADWRIDDVYVDPRRH